MPLDSRIIDLWNQPGENKNIYYEITPSGKYLIYDIFFDYEISPDGMMLTIHLPSEIAKYNRVGEPTSSLVGEWYRMHATKEGGSDEKETWVYLADGTYLGHWDHADWFIGYYEDTGPQLRTIEFRGNITTENYILHHKYDGGAYNYRYEFQDGEKTLILYDLTTHDHVYTYQRRPV